MAVEKRSRLPLVAGVVVVLVAVAVGGFLYFTRDTSDPPLELSDEPAGSDDTSNGGAVDVATLEGPWSVVAGSGDDATVAGYRVEEVFAAGSRRATANGRTNDVSGTLTSSRPALAASWRSRTTAPSSSWSTSSKPEPPPS